ncbi:MAG: hypothetical protein MJZ03_03880 [archaeon]|nr:hypothetical protein [archaeon]
MTKEEYKKQQAERSEGIKFIEGKYLRGFDTLVGQTVTITEYARMKTKNGDTFAFLIKEDSDNFYLANSILADMFANIDDMKDTKIKVSAKPSGKRYYPVELV